MSEKKSTALAKPAETTIATHSEPSTVLAALEADLARSLRRSLWIFGDAMRRHNAAWITGAVIGVISFLSSFFFTTTKIPPLVMGVLSFILIGIAAFNVWREQYLRGLDAASEISQLRRRIDALEDPPIQATVQDCVLWLGGGDLHGQDMWHWDVHFSLEIIPSLARPMTLSELCRIGVFASNSDEPIITGNIKRYWRDNTLAALPLDVFESARFACEVSVSSPIGHEPPDLLVAKISMSDMRSKWTKQLVINLRRDRSKLQPGWIAQTSSV